MKCTPEEVDKALREFIEELDRFTLETIKREQEEMKRSDTMKCSECGSQEVEIQTRKPVLFGVGSKLRGGLLADLELAQNFKREGVENDAGEENP